MGRQTEQNLYLHLHPQRSMGMKKKICKCQRLQMGFWSLVPCEDSNF